MNNFIPAVSEVMKFFGACLIGIIAIFIIQASNDSYSTIEMTWTIFGVVGLAFALSNLHDAILDDRALKKLPHDPKLKQLIQISHANIRQESLRSVKMGIIIAIGVLAGFTKPAVPKALLDKNHIPIWTTTSIILTVGIFLIVTLIVVQIFLDRRLRKKIYGRPHQETISERSEITVLHERKEDHDG